MKFAMAAAVISCLVVGYAVAQQDTQTPGATSPAQVRDDAIDRAATGQSDRATTQQGERSPAQITERKSAERYTAGFRGTPNAGGGQVEKHLAGCLLIKNNAEIEINEFAQQQAQNPKVKQFAQQMVQDHKQLSEELQKVAGSSYGTTGSGTRTEYERERETSSTTRLPGSSAAGQPIPPTGTTTATNENVNRNENTNASVTVTTGPNAESGALMQLAEIDKKIVQHCTQALREELQQKAGAEFDECYLGSQIGAHMQMLSALEVIGQESQGELKQVAQQAHGTVQQHLEHAKQLAKELKGASGQAVNQAERPTTRTTQ
jgi:predicted outer membrane protein